MDVTLWYGTRSGGIKTYLDAKRAHVAATGAFEHHVVVPGERETHEGGMHRIRGVKVTRNDYRIPPGGRGLCRTIAAVRPDVVLLHDPYWTPRQAIATTRAGGGTVVAVHHGSAALAAAGMPGPDGPWSAVFRAWMRHAYRDVDAVMSVIDPVACSGRGADLPLRLGLDAEFRPRPEVPRGDHVLYVGRLSRAKGVPELLEAARLSTDPWELRLVGDGPWRTGLPAEIAALGLQDRVRVLPYVGDRTALARLYAGASCVVMPGPNETFGLVGLEAAACGARVVACDAAPSLRAIGDGAHAFPAGDARALGRAIAAARRSPVDRGAAGRLAREHAWPVLLDRELQDLLALREHARVSRSAA
jgi:alpha-1,6-mannosyltransferase